MEDEADVTERRECHEIVAYGRPLHVRNGTYKKKARSQLGFVLLEISANVFWRKFPIPNPNQQTLWPRSYTHLRSVAP
jgi:hypothetical protein